MTSLHCCVFCYASELEIRFRHDLFTFIEVNTKIVSYQTYCGLPKTLFCCVQTHASMFSYDTRDWELRRYDILQYNLKSNDITYICMNELHSTFWSKFSEHINNRY